YASVLADRRTAIHARLVDVIERQYEGRLTEKCDVLAHHALRGEIWPAAVRYLSEMASRAAARGAFAESLRLYEDALAVLPRLHDSIEHDRWAIDIRLGMHAPLLGLGQIARLLSVYSEADHFAAELGDKRRVGLVAWRRSFSLLLTGRYREGLKYAEQTAEMAAAVDDMELKMLGTYVRASNLGAMGEGRAAADRYGEMLEGESSDSTKNQSWGASTGSLYIVASSYRAWMLGELGDFGGALQSSERAVSEGRRIGNWHGRACGEFFRGWALAIKGDHEVVDQEMRALGEFCEPRGLILWTTLANIARGWALTQLGALDKGVALLEAGTT